VRRLGPKLIAGLVIAAAALGLSACFEPTPDIEMACGPPARQHYPLSDACIGAFGADAPLVRELSDAKVEFGTVCRQAVNTVLYGCLNAIKAACGDGNTSCAAKAMTTSPACQDPTAVACMRANMTDESKTDEVRYWNATCFADVRQTDIACREADARLSKIVAGAKQSIDTESEQRNQREAAILSRPHCFTDSFGRLTCW